MQKWPPIEPSVRRRRRAGRRSGRAAGAGANRRTIEISIRNHYTYNKTFSIAVSFYKLWNKHFKYTTKETAMITR